MASMPFGLPPWTTALVISFGAQAQMTINEFRS
jgi:hypothetical protein